ncbi:MAG TPA: class II aldolase/adducin family protein [Syntrophomonadaceae bacterium]|nr:class II aldolase/adducin family protein [Syntrophomonadaceae bacterium]
MRYLKERKEVMDTAKEIFKANLVSGTWGNVSTRVNNEELMIITPSGMDYDSLTVEDMVLLDMKGNVQEGCWKPSVESRLHAQIYINRPDVGAIVHVHSLFATVFAVAQQKIPVLIEETAQVIGHEVDVAPYAICGTDELAQNTAKTLGEGRAVLMANHGLIGVGKNTADALKVCYITEKTAMIALYARQLGSVVSLPERDIAVLNQNFKTYGQKKS